MVRKAAKGIVFFLVAILILVGISVAPIDYTPLEGLEEINSNTTKLEHTRIELSEGPGELKVGWADVNITPLRPIHMAGYGRRGPYTSVSDSLFARTIAFNNGTRKTLVISLDLLMFPRTIKEEVLGLLQDKGYSKDDIFLSATHTHNAFGNWEKSIAGELIFGGFNKENSAYLSNQIVKSVEMAEADMSAAQVGFQQIDANEFVLNRLAPETGTIDPYLRIIHLLKADGAKGLIVSFAGHAVNLDADIWDLNRDYPGVLVDELEKDKSINFAMFCAGMVASHNIRSELPKGPARIEAVGYQLAAKIRQLQDSVSYHANSQLGAIDIDISMPPSQLRITEKFRLKDWVFSALFGNLQANIKVMEIGDILMIGMPCDFSGELSVNHKLDQFARAQGKELFITSCDHDEVRALNWVGPYKGKYFTEVIKKIIAMN